MANKRLIGFLALICLTGSACVDIPVDSKPPVRVAAVFDPGASVIPLPSSAALDGDGTLPDLGGAGAQGEFHRWLSQSYGWSPATPISFPFSGRLDPESLTAETFKLFRREADGSFAELEATAVYLENAALESPVCNPTVCASVVQLLPAQPLEASAQYAAVMTKGVRGADGESVSASTAMFFAASPEPLTVGGKSVVSSLDDPTARQLDGLRMMLAPLLASLEAEGLSRDELAAATVWGTSANSFSVLDPATATLPIPNTLALDADQTFPRAALGFCGSGAEPEACGTDDDCGAGICQRGTCVTTNCAQGAFDAYLDGLHGWPPTTPITLPVTAALNASTVSGATVRLFKKSGAMLEEVPAEIRYEEGSTVVQVVAAMQANTSYVAIATRGIETADVDAAGRGLPLLPAPAIAMAVQPFPVVDENGRSLVAEIPDGDAMAIAAAQSVMLPMAQAVEDLTGVAYGELAALWTWTTWTDTFVAFDPATARFPFPTAFATAGCPADRPICGLYDPSNPPSDPLQNAIFDEVSKRDGFSTTGMNWIPVDGPPLDAETIRPENVLFAEAESTLPTLLDAADYALGYEFDHILLSFNRPLKPGVLVAGVATTGLKGSNGHSAQPSPAFVFLRSPHPLVDGTGKSLVNVLDDATAAQLESARQAYSQLWLAAQIFGYSREEVVSAWAYTTGTPTLPVQSLRAMAMARVDERSTLLAHRACEPDCTVDSGLLDGLGADATYPHPDDASWTVDLSAVGAIQFNGELDTVNVLDGTRRILPYAQFSEPRIGVSVAVPKSSVCAAPYDVAVIQHGLGGYRKQMLLAMANDFAERCIATVAIDLPMHGGRMAGAATLHPETLPVGSGDGFVSGDLLGTTHSLMQTVVDLSVVTQYIRAGALDSLVGVPVSDADSKIGYVGISMGGFAGSLFSTVDPAVQATVLNVAGGNFAVVLTESQAFSSLLTDAGLLPGSLGYLQTLHFLQWLGEKVDPYTFAPHLVQSPLSDLTYDASTGEYSPGATMAARDAMVQMVKDDPTIPNTSTEILARTIGTSLDQTTFENTTHGFLSSGTSAQSECARDQAAEWIRTSFAGAATVPAELVAATCVATRSLE